MRNLVSEWRWFVLFLEEEGVAATMRHYIPIVVPYLLWTGFALVITGKVIGTLKETAKRKRFKFEEALSEW